MEKRTKLGLAAVSLAAAGTLVAPTTASANDVIVCPDPKTGCPGGDPFIKIGDLFLKLEGLVNEGVFLKMGEIKENIFIKLGDAFQKIEF